jgi:hypothetical protein
MDAALGDGDLHAAEGAEMEFPGMAFDSANWQAADLRIVAGLRFVQQIHESP